MQTLLSPSIMLRTAGVAIARGVGYAPPRTPYPPPVSPRRAVRIERLTSHLCPILSRFRRTGVLAHRRDGVQCARVIRPMASAASSSTETAAPKTADLKDAAGKDISGTGIRRRFLEFYEQRGHARLPSSSLVPEDPTVLLTIAGMLQFKPVFMGQSRALRPVRHNDPEVRADQRHRERGRHREAPHLLRDARQLLLRRLLQERSHPVRVGTRHEGVRPRRDTHLRLRLQGGRRGLRDLARRRRSPGGTHQAHGRGG